MKRFLQTLTVAAAAAVLLGAQAAEAHTCSSLCNQVRRACFSIAKATRKAERIQCDENRDACAADCEGNAATCEPDCQTANATCVSDCVGGGGDQVTCEAACAPALAQCLDDCVNCEDNCQSARDECRDAANAARKATQEVCAGLRTFCNENCVDPIDNACVNGCKADARGCLADVKKDERQCKKACARGSDRRACVRSCRKILNMDAQGCSDAEVLCQAGCAGITLPTPSATPAP